MDMAIIVSAFSTAFLTLCIFGLTLWMTLLVRKQKKTQERLYKIAKHEWKVQQRTIKAITSVLPILDQHDTCLIELTETDDDIEREAFYRMYAVGRASYQGNNIFSLSKVHQTQALIGGVSTNEKE